MKKIVRSIILLAGLLLLASCNPKEVVGPTEFTENQYTPTPIDMPSCTPEVTKVTEAPKPTEVPEPTAEPTMEPTEAPEPTAEPTMEPTEAPEPTAEPTMEPTEAPEPTAEPTIEPTEVPEPTAEPTIEPTEVPEPTAEPTAEPTVEPTEAPEPTAEPTVEPTEVPEPTAEPTVTPLPTAAPMPETDPAQLVNKGWQKTVSITENHTIIFPDVFRESTVEKTNQVLEIKYTCEENSEIVFFVSYRMQTNIEEVIAQMQTIEGTVFEATLGTDRVTYLWEKEGILYAGTLFEEEFDRALLGNLFGEEEWIEGVIQVVFMYPAGYPEYETEDYRYYIIGNREE